MRNRILLPRNS